jgi:membrane associated rhomboid family serine protease
LFPLYDENRPSSRPYVNYVLIAFNVAVFFLFYLQGWNVLENSIAEFGAVPWYILQGERLWTLFTSMFMHADIMHILGNMLYLWVFGGNIEDSLGHGKYILFYFVGGLLASFAHIFSMLLMTVINPASDFIPYIIYDLKIPSVGASGAISAVLGAYLLLFPGARIKTLVFYFFVTIVSIPALYYLGFWFIYQLVMGMVSLTGLSSGVAFWAHIGGFVFGLLSVKGFGVKAKRRPRLEREKPVRPMAIPWGRTPLVDVVVEPNKVTVYAMMPGVEEKDITVSVSTWEIDISAEHIALGYHKRITLPVPVAPQVENLIFNNSLLRFTLQRTE